MLVIVLILSKLYHFSQEKVYKEVISVLGTEDRYIEMKDVQNMPFLEQCIKETLRLFPTGPLILREATDDFKLSMMNSMELSINMLKEEFNFKN